MSLFKKRYNKICFYPHIKLKNDRTNEINQASVTYFIGKFLGTGLVRDYP